MTAQKSESVRHQVSFRDNMGRYHALIEQARDAAYVLCIEKGAGMCKECPFMNDEKCPGV